MVKDIKKIDEKDLAVKTAAQAEQILVEQEGEAAAVQEEAAAPEAPAGAPAGGQPGQRGGRRRGQRFPCDSREFGPDSPGSSAPRTRGGLPVSKSRR